ncbi:related to ADAM protease ADM-B [Serendipita indica DSM 11827]|uniref:Disintegrin and metalloproteinase domain-containing protein B n=1 Tax=Serendipita indica (strain DSM 11827) TaxID=1109443 RepID=G4TDN0_SERID|nr:related to ADAM protease ADM-B [Serendipita indica DSM 11827]
MLSYHPFAIVALFLLFVSPSQASSRRPPPLKRLWHLDDATLEVLPRSSSNTHSQARKIQSRSGLGTDQPRVQHTDSIRITISAFSDTFHLHLQPNSDLIHPAARVTYYRPGNDKGASVVDRVQPLLPHKFLVFGGDVIDEEFTDAKAEEDVAGGVIRPPYAPYPSGHRGWARITVLDAGDPLEDRLPVFEGAFSVDGVVHHVLTRDNYLRLKYPEDPEPEPVYDSEMVIFRDIDLMSHAEAEAARLGVPIEQVGPVKNPLSCAHDRLGYNVDPSHPVLRYGAGFDRLAPPSWLDPLGIISPRESGGFNATLLRKRQGDIGGGANSSSNFIDTIGQTAGCPTTQQIIYIGVAADCTYTQSNGGNTNATQSILRTFNTVSLLYKSTFNISLGIVELQISDPTCPTSDPTNPWNVPCGSVSLNERLSLFSAWRGQKFDALSNPASDPTGLWHLMSGCPSGGTSASQEVGVAWLGTVCMKKATGNAPSVVSGTGVSTAGRTEWQVISHEIGHNLGAIHDCTAGCTLSSNCCPLNSGQCDATNQFLMNPTSSATEKVFSPCTIGNICSLMRSSSIDTSCIKPPDVTQRTFSLQMCGNGIVEAGEECDPGAGSTSSCCDPATCKLINNAVCDPSSSSCCTSSCQFAPAGQICRPAKDAKCDVAESCTGTSAECPADKTAPNGQSCGADGLACAMGTCTSVSQQCRIVGASLNLTEACRTSDTSCQISCTDPKNPAQCIVLNSQLVDGSPCGFGGTCITGTCRSGTLLQTAVAWYTQNLQISIPVTVVVGIIVIVILWSLLSCLLRSCQKRKNSNQRINSAMPSNAPAARLPSWTPGMRAAQSVVPAGPFAVPSQRVRRNDSGGSNNSSRRRDLRIDDQRRPSDSSERTRAQENAPL